MARIDVTKETVLERLVAHLIADGDLELNARTCYLTLEPERIAIPEGGDWWVTVAPGEGYFDEPLETGAVIEQCTEDSKFTVTGYNKCYLDSTNRDTETLVNDTRGLVEIQRKLLKSLSGVDLTTAGGDTFLRELVTPKFMSAPKLGKIDVDADQEGLDIAYVSLVITCPFDWDLS